MSDLIHYTETEHAITLRFDNGKVNVLSPAMIAAINEALDRAEAAPFKAVIFTGREGMLSGGYDLGVMQQGGMAAVRDMVDAGSRLTRRMLAFPKPIIAACNGHAIAKGAFLLLASDYRIGVEGEYKISLNEVAIGLTMHHAGIELCRGRLAPVYFNRAMINAEVFNPVAAVDAGFLDKTVANEEALQQEAAAMAQHMATLNANAFAATKVKARKQHLDALDWAIEEDKKA
ncbi:crotonase/enoyl-CoA hydratase family protein [Pseudoteredinibacter isoporae]|uniref:Enoyl-CoA hydratase n=1 Tax=Pseudoteredinibacter isoporae TaxID=570281 RepID=A0A7X0MTV9_9GAMM|nr:crotonase/enoyl-CoA hydratase family protein [Pseudoteredinibacter isoporae]MBB6519961.1 enoyl-CoA hydratase [Pseudoteredinibacter isoporae]NHO85534.1 crotonase/enoyl-CoA hydratase family protein [Pseudoteredinibacter isoporae]NIB26014.1 crotonase/enoyl-CoA hydratase family protein [Pseudoteredinibacter isoporae]